MSHQVTSQRGLQDRALALLLAGTLITSAVHFLDNAFHLDLYPGPTWFTPAGVLLAWLAIPVLAYVAYRRHTRFALTCYALLGFAGLAHFIPMRGHPVSLRCIVTVAAEAITSIVLIVCALSLRSQSIP